MMDIIIYIIKIIIILIISIYCWMFILEDILKLDTTTSLIVNTCLIFGIWSIEKIQKSKANERKIEELEKEVAELKKGK